MQGAETENQAKSRSDEDSINFRPSPNFKHMKKYLKSKFEEANSSMTNPSSQNGASDASSLSHNKPEKVNKTAPEVQPPLPPNPPPPDTPPIINLKKEIEDDEYPSTDTQSDFSQTSELKTDSIKTDLSEASIKPEVTMCRNFIRGTCKKGAACRFAHELILSQLPGVYTFCRNFQNSVCTFPKCKFVHATVFEKEYFFRSGYLPPHTIAHLKEGNVLQPPPPPPEETPVDEPQVYANAPLQPVIQCIPPVPVVYSSATPSVEPNDPNVLIASSSPNTSPKREWEETEETDRLVNGTAHDLNSDASPAKKCKGCATLKFRTQYVKTQMQSVMRVTGELERGIAVLTKKNSKLKLVMGALSKPENPAVKSGMTFVVKTDMNLMKMFLGETPPDSCDVDKSV